MNYSFSLVLTLVFVTTVAAVSFVMPSLVSPTVPLGVNIPVSKVDEPVVSQAIRRYRQGIVALYVVCVGLAFILASAERTFAQAVCLLIFLAGQTVIYLVVRRQIQNAKAAGGWYENVPVRRHATIDQASLRGSVPVWWYFASFAIIAIVVSVGAFIYPSLPEHLPMHWNAAGEITSWAPKNIWSVFGPLIIGLGVVILLLAAAITTRGLPTSGSSSETRPPNNTHMLQTILGLCAVVVAVILSAITVQVWMAEPMGKGMTVVFAVFPLVLLGVIVALVSVSRWRANRAHVATGETSENTQTPSDPDDDRYWKAGLFYVNNKNPAFFVPKRFGIGTTLNFGHPGAIALMIGFLLLVILIPILSHLGH